MKRVQLIRHPTGNANVFTGLEGEVTVDITKKTLRVHDGVNSGGTEAAKADLTNVAVADSLTPGKMSASQAAELLEIYQPEITALAALTSAADKLPYFDGSGSATLADFTALARTLAAITTVPNFRAAISAAISGANNDITSLSGLTTPLSEAQGGTGDIYGSQWSTGDIKLTLKSIADTGWVLFDDGTIGNAASGATTRANADTETLFTLLWNNIADTWCAVSSGRGASAAADFAANKTIALPKVLGRTLAAAGTGASLTARALGQVLGEETHTLTAAEIAHNHETPSKLAGGAGWSVNSWTWGGTGRLYAWGGGGGTATASSSSLWSGPAENDTATSHNNMQPTSFLNIMVKL